MTEQNEEIVEETLPEKKRANPLVTKNGLVIANYNDMVRVATTMANSDLAPTDFRGKVANVIVAMQLGFELGISPMQAIQNIAVINGRPTIWGDLVPGLIYNSKNCEYIKIKEIGTVPDSKTPVKDYDTSYGFQVTAKRKDTGQEHSVAFKVGDAIRAGLWGKNIWLKYPSSMLKNRARTFCLRDLFPDILKGLYTAEEMRDIRDAEYEDVNNKDINKKLDDKITELEADTLETKEPLSTENNDIESGSANANNSIHNANNIVIKEDKQADSDQITNVELKLE